MPATQSKEKPHGTKELFSSQETSRLLKSQRRPLITCSSCGKHPQFHPCNRSEFTSYHWKAVVNLEFVLQASSKRSLNMETNAASLLWKEKTIFYFYQLHISNRLSSKKAFKIELQSSGLRGITEHGPTQRD